MTRLELTLDGGYLRFALPMTSSQIQNIRKIEPAFDIPVGLSLDLEMKMGTPILEVTCPTHPLSKITTNRGTNSFTFPILIGRYRKSQFFRPQRS